MFDWKGTTSDENVFTTVVHSSFSDGVQDGIATKSQNQHLRGLIVIRDGQWTSGKLDGDNIRVTCHRNGSNSALIGNFKNNILRSGTLYFKVLGKKYKFSFNNIEISPIYEYWMPQSVGLRIGRHRNRLYYYRSLIFGLEPEFKQNSIRNASSDATNSNTNNKTGATLYSEDRQIFSGQFILVISEFLQLTTGRGDGDKTKQLLCPLYLFLFDLMTNISQLKIFKGSIRYNSFNYNYKSVDNDDENIVTQGEYCPLKYKFDINSELIDLPSHLDEWKDMEKLGKYYYKRANEICTNYTNNPGIRGMILPSCPLKIGGNIKISVKLVPLTEHEHCNRFGSRTHCWRRELTLFPCDYSRVSNFLLTNDNIKCIYKSLPDNIKPNKIESDPFMLLLKDIKEKENGDSGKDKSNRNKKNDNSDNGSDDIDINDLRIILRRKEIVFHYYGSCKLYKSMFYRMPFLIQGNGIFYCRYKDVINKRYLNCDKNNININMNDYLFKSHVYCANSSIVSTEFVKEMTFDKNENFKVISKVKQLEQLGCKMISELNRVSNATTLCQHIQKLISTAIKSGGDGDGDGDDDGDDGGYDQLRLRWRIGSAEKKTKIESDAFKIVSNFLKETDHYYKCIDYIRSHWNKRQVISSLYQSQCHSLIDESLKHKLDNTGSAQGLDFLAARDEQGWNILHYGAYLNNMQYVQYCKDIIQDTRYKSLKSTLGRGMKLYQILLVKDNTGGNLPIHIAAQYGHDLIIQQFLNNSNHLSTSKGSVESKKLTQMLNTTKDGWTPIALSIIHDHVKCFQLLYHDLTISKGKLNGFTMATLAAKS